MENEDTEPTKKKAKREQAIGRLQSLLSELNGGEALDLTVLAAIRASPGFCDDGWEDAPAAADPHRETCLSTIDALFAAHVGTSPAVVVCNAVRVAADECTREWQIFDDPRCCIEEVRRKWRDHPEQSMNCKGPEPAGRVWVAMFLGEERAKEILAGTMKLNDRMNDDELDIHNTTEDVVLELLKDEASHLSVVELLANILVYVREEARKVPVEALLRFAVMYGLDGVMKDVLRGGYGDAGALGANTPLPLRDDDDSPRRHNIDPFMPTKLSVPAYALAAILGHENVVVAALAQPGATLDVPYGFQRGPQEETLSDHMLPSHCFLWVFMKNMPEMLACLVRVAGFQFRWIDHRWHLPMIRERIFNAAHYEDFPKWTALKREDLDFAGGSRHRCRLRAGAAYEIQMKMLDMLASLGFPLSLFFDLDTISCVIEREEALVKEKKLETRAQAKAFMRSMTKDERKAREQLYEACCVYNSLRRYDADSDSDEGDEAKESEMLTLGDYFRQLKSQFEGRGPTQTARLPEFEALDSRWRDTLNQNRRDEEDWEDSEYSYRDSDDGSSYGDPFAGE